MECSARPSTGANGSAAPAGTIQHAAGNGYIKVEASDYKFDFESLTIDKMIGMTETERLPTKPSLMTLHRWVHVGAKLDGGKYLRLPTFKLHGRRYTTLDAFLWWLKAQNGAA